MSSLCSVCNSYPCPGCTSRYIDDVVRLKAELAASTCECTELRKDVSALKRTYMADFLKVAVDALDDVEDAGSHPVGAPGSVKRRAQDIGKRLRATAEALARYGEHDGDCAASAVGAPGDARCTCGYDDAVANGLPPLRPRTR